MLTTDKRYSFCLEISPIVFSDSSGFDQFAKTGSICLMLNCAKARPLLIWSLVYAAVFFKTISLLPQQVGSKFDWNGAPVGFMSRDIYLYFNLGLLIVLNFSFFGIRLFLTPAFFKKWCNIPSKSKWISSDELLSEGVRRLDKFLFIGGTGANFIALMSHVMILNQNGINTLLPISLRAFLLVTVLFTVTFIFYSLRLFR